VGSGGNVTDRLLTRLVSTSQEVIYHATCSFPTLQTQHYHNGGAPLHESRARYVLHGPTNSVSDGVGRKDVLQTMSRKGKPSRQDSSASPSVVLGVHRRMAIVCHCGMHTRSVCNRVDSTTCALLGVNTESCQEKRIPFW
jgi:hypothetical protein